MTCRFRAVHSDWEGRAPCAIRASAMKMSHCFCKQCALSYTNGATKIRPLCLQTLCQNKTKVKIKLLGRLSILSWLY